jgi:hypothetical protein
MHSGNFCRGGKKGQRAGNGRLIVTKFTEDGDHCHCSWEVVKEVEIPATAYFRDYSGMSFRGDKVRVRGPTSCWVVA